MKILTTIILICGSARVALSQDNLPVETATNGVVVSSAYINRLVEEARTNNPGLRAANSRVTASTLNAEAVRTWEDPMAMFGGSIFSPLGMDPAQQGNLVYGVEQKLPLWGTPGQTRRVAEAETSMRKAEVNYRFQQLKRDITQALVTTALAEQVVNIGEQDLAWLNATAKAVENKYRDGQAALADTLQIQNELAERKDTLRTDRHLLVHQQFNLNRLLNREENSAWPPVRLPAAVPAISFSAKLLFLAYSNEPSLKVMEQEIKQAGASADLARRKRLPDVSLGIEGRQYTGDGEFREGDFTLRFSLPWGNAGKYRKEYDRQKELQKSAEQEREDQILMVKEQVHHFTVEIDAAQRQASLYGDEITTRAAQALSNRLTDWETGRGTLRDVLDARRALLESELTSAQAVAQEYQMLAELLLWTGLENLEELQLLANEPSILRDHDDH